MSAHPGRGRTTSDAGETLVSLAVPARGIGRVEVAGSDRYEPIVRLGHGGMADIYLALSNGPVGFNKLLALKLLRWDACEDPEILLMFSDEARLAAQLEHENLVHMYETGQFGGRPFIAMEYLQGQPLSRARRRVPELPLELNLWIITRVLSALHYAHELRARGGEPLAIVHRDVSPSNVMLTYDGRVKLLDFGIAKAASAENLSRVGVFKGKAGYSSPEQLRGARIDRRADVFSVGVTLWEQLVGRRLLASNDVASLRRRVEGAEDIRSGSAHVPQPLLAICERALSRRPEDRFETAEQMAAAIEAHIPLSVFRDAPRALASLLCSAFREDRAKLQASIDRHLEAVVSARRAELGRATVPELRALGAVVTGVVESGSRRRSLVSGGPRWLLPVLGVCAVLALVALLRGAARSPAGPEQPRRDASARGRPTPTRTVQAALTPPLAQASATAAHPEPAPEVTPAVAADVAASVAPVVSARPRLKRPRRTRPPAELKNGAPVRGPQSATANAGGHDLDTRDPWD